MLRRNALGRMSRPFQVTVAALAMIALLAGCFPPTTLTMGGTAAPATTPIATVPSPMTPTATSVAASPLPTGTTTPIATVTAVPSPTSVVTDTAIPTDLAVGIVVQKADNSIQVVDGNGSAMPLYQAPDMVDMASVFPPGNVVSDTMYLPLSGLPAAIVRLNAFGGQPVAALPGQIYGLAASPDRLAFGVADLAAGSMVAEVRTSALDGAQPTTVYSETMSAAPQVLRVFRWSPDGNTLYFGKEPVGLGGYILFGGLTNIWALDIAIGEASELVPRPSPNAGICIDDLSPDASMAAHHCNPKSMELIDVATQATRTVPLPAEVTDFGVAGGARFSPNGEQLAFALARRNPENEQGWVAIAEVAGGPSRLIATSPANDFFTVAGFLDADTLILQSGGQMAGVWTVDTDGQNLQRVSDGIFLGMLGGGPA